MELRSKVSGGSTVKVASLIVKITLLKRTLFRIFIGIISLFHNLGYIDLRLIIFLKNNTLGI